MSDNQKITNIEEGCIQCLSYFGIFKYPLSLEEIHKFNPSSASLEEVNHALNSLLTKSKIYVYHSYYLLENDATWVQDRIEGNRRALKLLIRSKKFVSIIASFPFVEAVSISGSLSKLYATNQADIDYFIITKSNRLWIARTLLHLFKKMTFLIGYQHYYCMNYFIDTDALQIKSQNMYSAIETATLIPVYNLEVSKEFLNANSWTKRYLPNFPGLIKEDYLINESRKPVKAILEFIINLCFPKQLNRLFMIITDRKWRKKWARFNYSESDYNRAFYTGIHISKNHPADFEKKILEAVQNEMQKFKS